MILTIIEKTCAIITFIAATRVETTGFFDHAMRRTSPVSPVFSPVR